MTNASQKLLEEHSWVKTSKEFDEEKNINNVDFEKTFENKFDNFLLTYMFPKIYGGFITDVALYIHLDFILENYF